MQPVNRAGKVFLTGAGPGDPGLLTLKAARALRAADVVLYDNLASDAVVAMAPAGCERRYVGKRAGHHAMPQEELNALLVSCALAGKTVVRLKGGDPFVFGRGGEEAQHLREAGVDFEVIPGITSAIAAPAYAGIPVTHRAHNTAFSVITGHEDPQKSASTVDWSRFADPSQTLVLLMAMGNLAHIVSQLMQHGLRGSTPVAVVRDGTTPRQQTLVATLDTVVEDVERSHIGSPATVVIGDVVALRKTVRWFDCGPLFGKRVLVTRPAHQSAEFAADLLEAGAEPILAPTIRIVQTELQTAERSAIFERLGDYRWIVFTSANGVDAFFDTLARRGADARAIGNLKVAAIGSKTAQALRQHGVAADLLPEAFVAESLAEELVRATRPGDRLLLYRARDARDVLQTSLANSGRTVHSVEAYATEFVDDPLFGEKVERSDVLTFTSASTVGGFIHNLGSAAASAIAGKIVACIGPITAEAATAQGLRVDIVAHTYTAAGLLAALQDTLESTPSLSRR
ncbi:MAG: uroporphyrinogen-III C-methyltransferase [Vulcanimicrobiaceae bacterium]